MGPAYDVARRLGLGFKIPTTTQVMKQPQHAQCRRISCMKCCAQILLLSAYSCVILARPNVILRCAGRPAAELLVRTLLTQQKEPKAVLDPGCHKKQDMAFIKSFNITSSCSLDDNVHRVLNGVLEVLTRWSMHGGLCHGIRCLTACAVVMFKSH